MAKDTTRFLAYRASAGAGKTYTLALEYLVRLLTSASQDAYRHILTVTFTNLATAEMKNRILEFLHRLSADDAQLDDLWKDVRLKLEEHGATLGDELIHERAALALKAILHDYSYFRVETIDAFLQSVLRNMAHELGLNARLRVELDNDQLVDAAVDRLIEDLRDETDDKVHRWLSELLKEELDEGRAWNVVSTVKSFALCIFDEAFQSRDQQEREALRSEGTLQQFVRSMRVMRNDCLQQLKALAEDIRQTISQIEARELNFDRINRGGDYLKWLARMEKAEDPRTSDTIQAALYDDSSRLLRKADAQLTAEAEEVARLLREINDRYALIYQRMTTSRLALNDINKLRLLGQIEDLADEIAEENNQFALSKTPTLLSELVGSDDAPFIFEKAGTTFRHVMIDEFQDTSRMQWTNFRILLIENQASAGSDLVVGDVKQSIYRWRNGDWRILQEIDKNPSLPIRPKVVPLKENYRSERRIVEFNNSFFSAAADELDKLESHSPSLADLYNDVEQIPHSKEDKGYVSVHLFKGTSKGDEAYWQQMASEMAERITDLTSRGVNANEMAILVREKNDGTELIRRFQLIAPEIPLISDEAFMLESSIMIRMLIAALRLLNNPQDSISAAFLEQHCIADFTDEERAEMLKKPLYLLCERLVRRFSTSGITSQDAYLNAFFDALQEFLRNGTGNLQIFLKAWDDSIHRKAVPAGNVSGVRVITIHKSKGLQFHTVFLPAMHWKMNKRMLGDKLWMKATEAEFNQLGPLPIAPNKGLSKSFYAKEFSEELFQKRVDALNLLYVAFTRAEKNLFIWGMTKAGVKKDKNKAFQLSDDASAGDIICKTLKPRLSETDADFTFEEGLLVAGKAAGSEAEDKSDDADKEKNRIKLDIGKEIRVPFVSNEPSLRFVQSNESQRFIRDINSPDEPPLNYTDIGKLLHYVLSLVIAEDDIPRIIEQSLEEGVIPDCKMAGLLQNRLEHGFTNELVRSWFSKDNEVYNEISIIGESSFRPNQHIHRPDRIVMSEGALTVIDYKFARPDEEHRNQVKAYIDLMQQMYPKTEVKGYLWYLYSGRVESVSLT